MRYHLETNEPARERDTPPAEPTTESLEVRVKRQNGASEVVDPNSGQTRTSPRFHIGSARALPGRGIGDERFLGDLEDRTTTGLLLGQH